MFNSGSVSLTSKQHESPALSTTEAEYVTVIRAWHNVVHFRQLMQYVHHQCRAATTTHEDNEGAFKLSNNPMASHMTKHIYIKHRYFR
jgi:hypothetical protein